MFELRITGEQIQDLFSGRHRGMKYPHATEFKLEKTNFDQFF